MKKKNLLLFVLVIIALFVFSACSQQAASSGVSAAPEKSAPAESTEPVSDYPKQSIKVVVPFSAGGGTDLFARIVCEAMGTELGVPMEVINVPGGSASIGTTQVVDSPADGYNLGFCVSSPLCIVPFFGEATYTLDDIQPIACAYNTLQVLVVNSDSGIKTIDDLIAYINDNGGACSYACAGTGNFQHLCMEEWVKQAGDNWNLTVVPYDGDSDQIAAVMSGEVPFAIIQLHAAKSAVEAGNILPVMVFGNTETKWITDWSKNAGIEVPTSVSRGWTASMQGVVGFWGPKGISDDVIQKINDAFVAVKDDPDVVKAINNIGLEVEYHDTKEYTEILNNLKPIAGQLLQELGFINK